MTPSGPFITEEAASERLNMSRGTLISAIQRGEMPGVMRVGRSVRIFWPAIVLASLGTDAVALARQLGIKDLDGLLTFLSGEGS